MPTIEDLLREGYTHWDDAAVLSRVGSELQHRCRYLDAEALLGRAVELAPGDVGAWANLSYAQFRRLRAEEGRATLQRGIEASGSDELKTILMAFSSPEEAAQLQQSIEGSDDPVARAALIARRLAAAEDDGARGAILDELCTYAQAHAGSEEVQAHLLWSLLGGRNRGTVDDDTLRVAGLPAARAMAEADPDSMMGWWFLLQMNSSLKDWQAVLEVSASALEHAPDEETTLQLRGRAFRELGFEEHAAQCFLRAIGAKPSFAGARVDLGRLYEAEGKLDLAEEIFREIPQANSDYPLGFLSLALFLTRQGRLDEAEAIFMEGWPEVPEMFRPAITQNSEAAPLLERAQIQKLVGA